MVTFVPILNITYILFHMSTDAGEMAQTVRVLTV